MANAGFDVAAFKKSLRPGVAYREGYTGKVVVTQNKYDAQVLLLYNGVQIPIGAIVLIRRPGSIHIERFDSYYRTKPWLARLRNECFPQVATSGVLTSALYWLIQSLMPDVLPLQLTLQAVNLVLDDEDDDGAGQAKLEAHYAMLGFEYNENFHERFNMSTSVAHFLRTTRDLATITFIFIFH